MFRRVPVDCDVLIAGAGPAGSQAARTLARAGWRVLILEKKDFPRLKPCGGCLSRRVERLLPTDLLNEVAEGLISRVIFTFGPKKTWEYTSPQPGAYMVRRENFDLRLIREAERYGSRVRFQTPLTGFDVHPDHVAVSTPSGTLRSRHLILSHGAYGLASPDPRRTGLNYHALEGRLDQTELARPWPRDTVAIHLGEVRFGYGWTFPCGDHLSIGLSFLPKKEKNARRSQKKFLDGLPHSGSRPRLKGHPIPCYDGRPAVYSRERVLWAGDAARLVEPFLGEGIYYALWSGQLAGETIAGALENDQPDLSAYDRSISRQILPEFEYALRLARLVYAWPGLFWWNLKKHPGIMTIYFSILQGQESYGRFFWEIKQRIRKYSGIQRLFGDPPREIIP